MNYSCKTCGQIHEGLPLSYGADAPYYWYGLEEKERKKRAILSSDQCIIDDEYFFVLGQLEIPILNSNEVFCWLVWVSLSKANFERMSKLWRKEGRESEPPYFGWLSTSIDGYPETVGLKTNVHTRPVNQGAYVELEPTDHPLAIEQREGISWERIQSIAESLLHDYP
jgi:hypothetical protein